MANSKKIELVEIKPLDIQTVTLKIVGDSPLIMHNWSFKAARQVEGVVKGMPSDIKESRTSKKKEARDPWYDFAESAYWLDGKPEELTEESIVEAVENGKAAFGFPVTAFKQASISAAYRMGWVPDKMSLRGAFFIDADGEALTGTNNRVPAVRIHSDAPIMRADMVTVGISGTDIRYRPEFRNWWAELKVRYNANGKYSLNEIVNIINAGGYVCGIGEWRPERDGQYGCYHIEA